MIIENMDSVIQHCAAAARANSREVSRALTTLVAAQDSASRANAATALRIALVAQAAGHEAVAHDGSTFAERCEHARLALAAWATQPEQEAS